MIEVVLIIALVVAVCFDAIRVYQYIQLRKSMQRNGEIDFRNRIDKLFVEWNEYVSWEEKEHKGETIGKYCLEHWND